MSLNVRFPAGIPLLEAAVIALPLHPSMAETSSSPDTHGACAPRDPRVRAAQAGDRAAFAGLYREHVARVYALCLRTAGQPADADAVTQEVFVRAWEKLHEFREECPLSAWLHRIAVRQILMHHRTTSRRLRRIEPTEELPSSAASREERPDAAVDLERAIRTLPEGPRLVFVLAAVEGYAHAEIAIMMGCTEATCRAHLFHAKAQLREVLDG
jgi:RNA polymerase sigma-70 factor, ECF subfamily